MHPDPGLEPDGLFVYGTLRRRGSNHAWLERTNPQGICGAWVPGRLFHLPDQGYPAVVPEERPVSPPPSSGWVHGEFVGYDEGDLPPALMDLDQLEDTDGGLFQRTVLPCMLESGHLFAAWVYVFPVDRLPTLERQGVELAEGDWAPFLSHRIGTKGS